MSQTTLLAPPAPRILRVPRPGRTTETLSGEQRVIPLRHPGRWIASAAILVVAAQIVHGLATNTFFQWDRFAYWFARPVVLQGVLITLEVTALSAVLGLIGGLVLALMRSSASPVLRSVAWAYIWFFRSVPLNRPRFDAAPF